MPANLRVLLLGRNTNVAATGNAILGREVFDHRTQPDRQSGARMLEDGRQLHVTILYYKYYLIKSNDVLSLSTQLESNISSGSYHAVVFVMGISPELYLSYPTAASLMLKEPSLKQIVKRKSVNVVIGGESFRGAQREGKITVSFIEWLRTFEGIYKDVFQETQERCLLFNSGTAPNVRDKQRSELILMIDGRVMGVGHYKDAKLKEARMLPRQLTKGNEELSERGSKKTSRHEQTYKDISDEASQRSQKLEMEKDVSWENEESDDDLQTIEGKPTAGPNDAHERSKSVDKHLPQISGRLENKTTALEHTESQQMDLQPTQLKVNGFQENTEREVPVHTEHKDDTYSLRALKTFLWSKAGSVSLPQPLLNSPWRGRLLLLLPVLALIALLAPFSSRLWPETAGSISQKEIAVLDMNLRRYVDVKYGQTTKRLEQMDHQLDELKTQSQFPNSEKSEEEDNNDPDVSKIWEEMAKHWPVDKERLFREVIELNEQMRKNITRELIVWDTIKSLPLSMTLLMVMTLVLQLLTPAQLPMPWSALLALVLISLLILQPVILLTLLGV